MNLVLNAVEARVLGCMLEKERTTPEYYPMTVNALVNACNQKSNRDPQMSVSEAEVHTALDTLRIKSLTYMQHTAGGRVPKHSHRLGDFFTFSPQESALVCLLLLRGPQTAGELRSRSGRMAEFQSPSEVETALQELATREDGPFAVKLPRQPGKSSCRYAHLFCGPVDTSAAALDTQPPADAEPTPNADNGRLATLEEKVAALRIELDQIKEQLGIKTPDGL